MTLKQEIHELVDELPDDSPVLGEVRETLRMSRAIGAAMEDVREGRSLTARSSWTGCRSDGREAIPRNL